MGNPRNIRKYKGHSTLDYKDYFVPIHFKDRGYKVTRKNGMHVCAKCGSIMLHKCDVIKKGDEIQEILYNHKPHEYTYSKTIYFDKRTGSEPVIIGWRINNRRYWNNEDIIFYHNTQILCCKCKTAWLEGNAKYNMREKVRIVKGGYDSKKRHRKILELLIEEMIIEELEKIENEKSIIDKKKEEYYGK